MDEALLALLRPVTEEEERLLENRGGIERADYTSSPDFTVDGQKLLARGQLIGVRRHTRFAPFPRHSHNYVELMYMCQGSTTHIIGSARVVLQSGELLFLNRHSFHEILPAGAQDLGINFMILPEFFDAVFPTLGGERRLEGFLERLLRRDGEAYLHFATAGLLPVRNLVENMLHALLFGREGLHRLNQTTMALLLMELLQFRDCLVPGQEPEGSLAALVRDYIDAHYREATLTELCARLGQTPAALSRRIHRATGSTFKELLQQKRLETARELLCASALSVADIIAAVGYENSSYFYRVFERRFACSPRQYRLEQRSSVK